MFFTIKDSDGAEVTINSDNICSLSVSGSRTMIDLAGGQRVCTEVTVEDLLKKLSEGKAKR